jgi:hypothetical protein
MKNVKLTHDDPKKKKVKKGKVTTKKCKHCGHHEVGIVNDAGEFTPLKTGMKIQIEEV